MEKKFGIALKVQKESRDWRVSEWNIDLYDLKGLLELLFEGIGIRKCQLKTVIVHWLEEETSIQIMENDNRFGILDRLSSQKGEVFVLIRPAFVAELDFDYFIRLTGPGCHKLQATLKFRPVLRDLAIIIENLITYKQATDLIWQEGGELLKDVSLFGIYAGAQIPEGKKSLAFSLTYRSDKGTLTDEEVNEVHQHIFNRLNSELGA